MYSPLQLAYKYFNYWLKAMNGKGHGIHSPFVFEFVTKVLNGKGEKHLYAEIESVRRQLRKNETMLEIADFGAGSRVAATKHRTVKQVARTSLKPKKYSQLLHRMVHFYAPQTVLEIGTSLGITTAYMAKAKPGGNIITMEGAPSIAVIAKANFDQLHITNIQQVTGNFDNTLAPLLSTLGKVDLAFIDGNHRYEPTLNYYRQILDRSHDHTIIILDDIYWSNEMEQAWQWVKVHERTKLTIDLFAIGIVVLRPEIHHKQHFAIRF